MPDEKPLLTETSFHVRFAETDQMGVVHHSVYLVYFEEGRSAMISSIWVKNHGSILESSKLKVLK